MRNPAVRALFVVLGVAFLAGAAAVRYSDRAITAVNGALDFRFFGAEASGLPVWLVWGLGLAFALGALLLTQGGRLALRGMFAQRSGRAALVVSALLLLLTLLPLPYSRGPFADQSVIVYLIFGSIGLLCLALGLGSALSAIGRPGLRVYSWLMDLPPLTFVLAAALFSFLVSNVLSWAVFEHVPRIHDNVAQVFQARLFTQGRLYADSPPLPQFFDLMLMNNHGRWYSQYPPGHPLLLALGVLIRAPWIVNPLLGACTVVLVFLLGRELFEERTARVATLLIAFSPFLYLSSSQFMNHSSSLSFAGAFMLCYVRTVKRGGLLYPILAGLSLGMVVLVRPFTAALVAVPFALDALDRLARNLRRNLVRYGLLAICTLLMVGLLAAYNYLTTGSPWQLGYVARYGAGHGLGFNRGGWSGPGYTLANAVAATSLDLNAVNRFLFEFPIPTLLFVALAFVATARGPGSQTKRWNWVLLGVFVTLVAGHFFYWWHDLLFGPRWEYEALPALVLLSAQGLRALPRFIFLPDASPDVRAGQTGRGSGAGERARSDKSSDRVRGASSGILTLCYLSALGIAVPTLIMNLPRTFGIQTSSLRTVQRANLNQALVLTSRSRYGDLFLANQVPPGGKVVYAHDLAGLNPLLTRYFPGRAVCFASLDTLREMAVPDWAFSQLKQGLDSTVAELSRVDLSRYRYLYWPVAELRDMVEPIARRYGLKVYTYRELDQLCVGKNDPLRPYLPAVAVRIINDQSEDLMIFHYLDSCRDFMTESVEFHYIGSSTNGTIALYDVRLASDVRR